MIDNPNEKVNAEDWAELKRLRQTFLSESFSSLGDYWCSSHLLKLYHKSFAQRIGWKWDAVLKELKTKKLLDGPIPGIVIDYGCGTGIASHKVMECLGRDVVSSIYFGDKSPGAVRFSIKEFQKSFPGMSVQSLDLQNLPSEKWILCLSHIINELSDAELKEVVSLIEKSEWVIWVEPGTSSTSRKLIEVRERVREKMDILAPCPHQQRCGMLSSENDRHWCHFFAAPPVEVFQTAFWGQFSRELNIDLRSLPTSYLVFRRKETRPSTTPSDSRVIGRPRLYKGNGKFLICNNSGVREITLLERSHRDLFKEFKKDIFSKMIPEEGT